MDYFNFALKGVPKLAKAGPKVLVPIGVAAVGAVAAATRGALNLREGSLYRDNALQQHLAARAELSAIEVETEYAARSYGTSQIDAHKATLGRFADWLERNEAQVKQLNFQKVDGVRIRVPRIPNYVAGVRGVSTGVAAIASAVGVGAAAPAAALWGVSTFATAGTGAAISGLSGAAATNATLAALGGGTLAAGGGGMAAGAAVLGLTAAAPALLVGGFAVGVVGARVKTSSRRFAAQVEVEIARMARVEELLYAVQRRIGELQDLLDRASSRAVAALDVLESVEFDTRKHASEFLRSFQLVTAVKEILNTPVLDPTTGDLSEESIKIVRRFA